MKALYVAIGTFALLGGCRTTEIESFTKDDLSIFNGRDDKDGMSGRETDFDSIDVAVERSIELDANDESAVTEDFRHIIQGGTWKSVSDIGYNGGRFGQPLAWMIKYRNTLKADYAVLKYSSAQNCSFDNVVIRKLTRDARSRATELQSVFKKDATWKEAIFSMNGGDPVELNGLHAVIDGQPFTKCALQLYVHIPGDDTNSWCGLTTNNAGSHPSIYYNGTTSGAGILCQDNNPAVSCPEGYSKLVFQMRAWGIDTAADTVATCVGKPASRPRPNHPRNEWCGAVIDNQGNRASIYLDKVPSGSIQCLGHVPTVSCPDGYDKLKLTMAAWSDDKAADALYTCVMAKAAREERLERRGQGKWCGTSFANSGNRPSIFGASPSACLGQIPATGCQRGYKQLSFCMRAWGDDTEADCMATCVAE